ncbi:hypothetical protein [Neisseria sp. S1]|uniref:hypothetical protein n=1 Tax=Neisseria sp. S1 TaxID=3318354 RepID=UPI003A85922A
MKKLLATTALIMMLSACASNDAKQEQQSSHPQGANPAIEQALQECQQTTGAGQDRAAFDACMKEKGFERPAEQQPAATSEAAASAAN